LFDRENFHSMYKGIHPIVGGLTPEQCGMAINRMKDGPANIPQVIKDGTAYVDETFKDLAQIY
jgi:hypothetical protein